MNRRDFLAATAAAGACVTLPAGVPLAGPVAASAVGVIPWRMFVEQEPSSVRQCLTTPFVRSGHLYASDRYVAIRATTKRPDTKAPTGRHPEAEKLPFWPAAGETGWEPWPERSAPADDAICPRCWMVGRVGWLRECEACDGLGAIYGGYDDPDDARWGEPDWRRDCDACSGNGGLYASPCDYCGGKGKGLLVAEQAVGNRLITGWMDWRIRMLPGPIEWLPGGDYDDAIVFRFTGGEGVAMPLDRPPSALSPR